VNIYVFICGGVTCRHEESIINGCGAEIDYPFITGRSTGGGGITFALVDNILDLAADFCNLETLVIILFTVAFAIYIELFCAPNLY